MNGQHLLLSEDPADNLPPLPSLVIVYRTPRDKSTIVLGAPQSSSSLFKFQGFGLFLFLFFFQLSVFSCISTRIINWKASLISSTQHPTDFLIQCQGKKSYFSISAFFLSHTNQKSVAFKTQYHLGNIKIHTFAT